ncbi:AI-2E family transporter [Desulfocurvibacter africanus]|uniref:AI-2E family transporter n=1 Tax=Desulfocurvibacter africanus TaxID=873 RepID=UPI002FD91CE3
MINGTGDMTAQNNEEPSQEARLVPETTRTPSDLTDGGRRPEDTGPLHAKFYRPFLLLVFIGAVAVLTALLWPFRHAIILAAILALLLAPLRQRMLPVLRGSRIITAALLTSATFIFIVMPTTILAVVLANEAASVIEAGIQWFNAGGMTAMITRLKSLDLPVWLQMLADRVPFDPQSLEASLVAVGGELGKRLLSIGRGFAGHVAGFLFQIVMLLLFLFYFLVEGKRVVTALRRLSPLRRSQEQELAERLKIVARSIVVGGIAAGLTQGVATAIGLWLVGLDALFWGMIAMVAALVPVIGLALIHIPVIVYLLIEGATGQALGLLAWWLLVVSTVDNFVRPFFISGSTQLPLLLIFVSIVGGLLLFGPLGLIYGPVTLSLCLVVFQLFIAAQTTEEQP